MLENGNESTILCCHQNTFTQYNIYRVNADNIEKLINPDNCDCKIDNLFSRLDSVYIDSSEVVLNQSGDYKNGTLYSNINLEEQFSPLIRLEFEMKNSIKVIYTKCNKVSPE